MIEFILGRSGSGKSELIFKAVSELEESSEAILIVPEQSSFYNEKQLLSRLGERKVRNIQVLSFRRLCSNILEQYKGRSGKRISDGVKAVLMNLAIENAPAEGGELELYCKKARGGIKKTVELIDPMLVAVNEYKMCMITPEQLFEAAKRVESRVLASKLRDSARIYAAYNAILGNAYEDPDDDLVRLYDILGDHRYFEGKTVLIDSFTGFSAQEIRIIERIFEQSESIYISLCCDRDILGRESSVFSEPADTYRRLLRAADKTGHRIKITQPEKTGIRFRSPALAAVEAGLFSSFRSGIAPEKCKNDGSVVICRALGIYEEISWVARRIFELVHEQDYKYNEIEIITRDLDKYKSIIRTELPKYGIPYFLSENETLDGKNLVRMITSVFDVIHGGYDAESVIRLAKCGFTGLSEYDTFELEDYAFIWSVRGSRWKEPFTMSPDGIGNDRRHDDNDKRLERIEEARKRLIDPVMRFEADIRGSEDGTQMTAALYRYMEAVGCSAGFREYITRLEKTAGGNIAEREASVWDKLMGILDSLYDVLSGKRIDSRSYLELLRVYIRKTPVGDIPRTVSSVTAGVAGSIRSEAPRAVFAIGCNEGEFPMYPGAVGIFTDSERRLLREECPADQQLPLYEGIFANSLKEKYNVYAAFSAPSEKLFVSYHTQNAAGASSEPSAAISELLAILPDTVVTSDRTDEGKLFSERQCFDLCAVNWKEKTPESEALRQYFLEKPKYRDRAMAISRFAEKEPFSMHDHRMINRLFGSPMRLSSTKLDQFAACKFAYYCKFGIEVYPLRKASMDSGLYGTAMHYIFEQMLREHKIEEFITFDDDRLKEEIKKYLDRYVSTLGNEQERTNRFTALCMRIRRNAFKTLRRMRLQFMHDKFRPEDFELRIGADDDGGIPAYELELPTGERLIVSGFVDRVDTITIGNDKYIRIIDYKTGNDVFKLGNIANGMKLQMLLYLSAIMKNGAKKYSEGKRMLPAGVLYVPSTAKTSAAVSNDPSALSQSYEKENKNFRMNGLLLAEKDILELMESGLEGNFIPANVNKRPPYDLSSRSSVVTNEQFELIFRYIDHCLKAMGTELYSGNIEAYPEKQACQFCDYKSVCRFETGDKVRELHSMEMKEALSLMEETDSGEEDNDG